MGRPVTFPEGSYVTQGNRTKGHAVYHRTHREHICLLLAGCLLLIFSLLDFLLLSFLKKKKRSICYKGRILIHTISYNLNFAAVLLDKFIYFNHKKTEIRKVTNVIKPTQLNMAELETGHPPPHFFFLTSGAILFPLGLRH